MKTKRFFAGLSAFAIAAAMLPVSAFADNDPPATQTDITITQDTQKNTDGKQEGSTTATYTVTPSYIVTIPSTAVINDEAAQTKQNTTIAVTEMKYMMGKKIVVKLDKGSNTASGSTFKATNGTSEVTYNINKGDTALKAGDTVGEFTEESEKKSVDLTLVKTGGTPTAAGAHTEQLTFSIAVEEEATKTLTLSGSYFNGNTGSFVTKSLEIEYNDNDTWKDIAERYDEVSLQDNIYGPEGKVVRFWYDISQYIAGCELKSDESTYDYNLVSMNDKVSAYSSYFLQG